MSNSSGVNWLKVLGLLGVAAIVAYKGPKLISSISGKTRKSRSSGLYNRLTEAVDQKIGWDKLPPAFGLAILAGIRNKLRAENLYDTESTAPSTATPVPTPSDTRYRTARTADGTYNDLDNPRMGSAGTRFGRNVPIELTYPEPEPDILTPNPRTVSRELLTRDIFHPATTLNVLAAAWLQFMIRDWFSHGASPKENPWKLPLKEDDPWHENPMLIMRTRTDPTRPAGSDDAPPTYVNTESHWWDGSSIYGSNKEIQMKFRSGVDGKLKVGSNGMIPIDPDALMQPGVWLGLITLHNLFSLEHNAICDRLRAEYPSWSDDDLFDRARLINAALLAKIHTVEWTTGILGHPTLQIAMRANWWGLAGEWIYEHFGRLSSSELISGIPGSKTHHYEVPYSLTEEFVAVYRLHPLMPDDYSFRSVTNDGLIKEHAFPEIAGQHVADILNQISIPDILYSFGVAHPGAIQLHNYPRFLQRYERPDGLIMDLAATDIMRSRELGVPRYNQFRQLLHKKPVETFEELTDNPVWAEEIRRVYNNDIDRVDLTVGLFAERPPEGFGFSDTAFRIFVLMASRRLNSDRFFTVDYTPEVYTKVGMKWIDDNTMSTVLLRHYPQLKPALSQVKNAFAPWTRVQKPPEVNP
jgi:hypothetical protein